MKYATLFLMGEFWDDAFIRSELMWGLEPTAAAVLAGDYFEERGVKDVLIPGIGYGRNARPFLERGMCVTGIEISDTAIGLARSKLALDIVIHHGAVTNMPFDELRYDAVFCFGLIYLLDVNARQKLLHDCTRQLAPGGLMIFTVISKEFEMYGKGQKLGEDWYEVHPGVKMFFYDEASIRHEFGQFGLTEIAKVEETMLDGSPRPFLNVICAAKR